MLVRVRTSEGQLRVDVSKETTVKELVEKIEALLLEKGVQTQNTIVANAPRPSDESKLDATKTLSQLKIVHGDMLYAKFEKTGEVAPVPVESSSNSLIPLVSKAEPLRELTREEEARRNCPNHGPRGSCVRCMQAAMIHILSWEEKDGLKKCDKVSFSHTCADAFQRYVRYELAFSVQRCGILYGTVDEETNTIFVECIYEPMQQGTPESVAVLSNEKEEVNVDLLVAMLGLKQVGWINSHVKSESAPKTPLNSSEMTQTGEFMKTTGAPFVAAVVSVNDEGKTQFEAFETTMQFSNLVRDGLVIPSTDPEKIFFKERVYVERIKETDKVDVHRFIRVVPIVAHKQNKLRTSFQIENRRNITTTEELRKHLDNNTNLPLSEVLMDFHLLLFLLNFLDISVLGEIIERAKNGQPIAEGHQLLIDSICGRI